MTEVCEVWSAGQLAALVIGTTALASAAVLAVILGCVWLAHTWPACSDVDDLAVAELEEFRLDIDGPGTR